MRPLRVIIVDDEPPAREALAALLAEDPDVRVVGVYIEGVSAAAGIRELRPDLVFLDVEMPERDGLDVVAGLSPEERPAIVFVTAHDQHAIRAFELSALDYLLKPFSDERLAAALARAKERLRSEPAEVVDPRLDRIALKVGADTCLIDPGEILWVEAQRDLVLVAAGKQVHRIRATLQDFGKRLRPPRFQRVHRSFIVNWEQVRRLSTGSNHQVTLTLSDGTRIPVGRSYRPGLALPGEFA